MTNIILLTVIAAFVFIGLLLGLKKLLQISSWTLIIGSTGVVLGLIVGALTSIPLSHLPGVYGQGLPAIVTVAAILLTTGLLLAKRESLVKATYFILPKKVPTTNEIIIDTSVLIDGRVADIAKSGFVIGKIIVPRFILGELQKIADSSDSARRNRGRRGLEVLETLQEEPSVKVEILDSPERPEKVDAQLVKLAKERGAALLTTDFNLNKVATIDGVRVLNINELANAIRPVFLPGEEITVQVVQNGKEKNQGVGYLPDGTMIVVEGGDKMMGQEVPATVTRMLQTAAGKMVFVQPKK